MNTFRLQACVTASSTFQLVVYLAEPKDTPVPAKVLWRVLWAEPTLFSFVNCLQDEVFMLVPDTYTAEVMCLRSISCITTLQISLQILLVSHQGREGNIFTLRGMLNNVSSRRSPSGLAGFVQPLVPATANSLMKNTIINGCWHILPRNLQGSMKNSWSQKGALPTGQQWLGVLV